jgi:hypothetical protein
VFAPWPHDETETEMTYSIARIHSCVAEGREAMFSLTNVRR